MVAKCVNGTFIPPGLFETGGIDELQDERFGPILHVVRCKESGFENVLKNISLALSIKVRSKGRSQAARAKCKVTRNQRVSLFAVEGPALPMLSIPARSSGTKRRCAGTSIF
jgi:hypothetical protein